ncbi:MAG: hypothetical protein V4507_13255, partial [Verrucomicrobiota bacterium]
PLGKVEFASGVLLIALATGAPILIGTVTEAKGGYYDLIISPPLVLEKEKNREQTLRKGTEKIRDILLPILQRNPNQWFQFTNLTKKQDSNQK